MFLEHWRNEWNLCIDCSDNLITCTWYSNNSLLYHLCILSTKDLSVISRMTRPGSRWYHQPVYGNFMEVIVFGPNPNQNDQEKNFSMVAKRLTFTKSIDESNSWEMIETQINLPPLRLNVIRPFPESPIYTNGLLIFRRWEENVKMPSYFEVIHDLCGQLVYTISVPTEPGVKVTLWSASAGSHGDVDLIAKHVLLRQKDLKEFKVFCCTLPRLNTRDRSMMCNHACETINMTLAKSVPRQNYRETWYKYRDAIREPVCHPDFPHAISGRVNENIFNVRNQNSVEDDDDCDLLQFGFPPAWPDKAPNRKMERAGLISRNSVILAKLNRIMAHERIGGGILLPTDDENHEYDDSVVEIYTA